MRRVLYVGDPHARPEDLEDCLCLVSQVVTLAEDRDVDRIVILGDLHHTHALAHTDVTAFWRESLVRLVADDITVTLLVGNHDQPGDEASKSHALLAYKDMRHVVVVDEPMEFRGILYLPYIHRPEDFVAACRANPVRTVVCHQTFNGAKYENSFYAKDGVEPSAIPQVAVISGHIHEPQEFDKVRYLGSPRWLATSDANRQRFIHVVEHNDIGDVVSVTPIPSACRQIVQIVDTPEAPWDRQGSISSNAKYLVDITGPAAWITERLPLYAGWARVRTSRTDQAQARVRESEGLPAAMKRYLAGYKATRGTPSEVLEGFVRDRISFAV